MTSMGSPRAEIERSVVYTFRRSGPSSLRRERHMLTQAENELVTRVGPGTPMGALLRRYWFPVLKAERLIADGAPQRVRLLGENFVAWRASDGRIGFFAEGCPHRKASLVLGRNERCTLTCIFHGWKIDVDGHVV